MRLELRKAYELALTNSKNEYVKAYARAGLNRSLDEGESEAYYVLSNLKERGEWANEVRHLLRGGLK